MPAFIDVCIDGLIKCLLDDFLKKLPEDCPGFTEEEATQALMFT